MQQLLVASLFLAALGYLGRLLYQSFTEKSGGGCASGCGKCGALDINKIEAQIRKDSKQLG